MLLIQPGTFVCRSLIIILGKTQPSIMNSGCFSPKHELIRLIACHTMRHGIISKHQRWNMQRLIAVLFLWERLQKSKQCTIKSFTDGISTQIVRHGHGLLDVIHGVQLSNYGIFKNFGPCHCEYGLECHTHRTIFLLKPWQQ